MKPDSLAGEIADEHILYVRRQGLTPREVLALVGAGWVSQPAWADARAGVARAWIDLQAKIAGRRQ